MNMNVVVPPEALTPARSKFLSGKPVATILAAVCVSHLLNDLLQSLLPAIYPLLKTEFSLSFAEVGLITLVFQLTGSVLQPLVGAYTDKHPAPYSAAFGMISSLSGLVLLSLATNLPTLLLAAGMVGIGSAVFHPESSRIARAAAGGRFGLAQSVFQTGGNLGTAIGPLMAALIVVPNGRHSVAFFVLVPLTAMMILFQVGRWYRDKLAHDGSRPRVKAVVEQTLPKRRVVSALAILIALMFSKFFYTASMSTFYIFFLIHKFGLPVREAQFALFGYLAAFAAGTLLGGPIGDRIGRLPVIWVSILGALPLTLIMPHVSLPWTIALSMGIGFILSSAFSTILVYAQELVPGRVGMISGMFFGLAFGMGGLGAGLLGLLADAKGVEYVFWVCSFLPAIGLLIWFLPDTRKPA